MYVDGVSASEVLYEHCFNRLRTEIRNQMTPAKPLILGFSGEISWPLGHISLMVSLGDAKHLTSARMNFMVVQSPSLYNIIIGRPGSRKIQVVSSTAHGLFKFPVKEGEVTLHSSTVIPAKCRMIAEPQAGPIPNEPAMENGIKVAIHP
ncbi:hypothetical protein Tco_1363200 [Tanacetum coccineum]